MLDRRPTLVELEAFRATMAEGTTAGAGRRLGRSQSSISRAVAELERRIGKALFERRGRLIVATADAVALDRSLDPVFAALDALRTSPGRGPETGEIAVAAPPAFAMSLVPRAFSAFRREFPNHRLRLEVLPTRQTVDLVAAGEVDIGLTDSVLTEAKVHVQPFCQTQIACIVPIGHRLAALDRIAVADLRGETFITPARGHSMRAQVDAILAGAGIEYAVSAETSTAVAALALIEAGAGIGLFNPFPLIGPEQLTRVACRPLAVEMTYRSAFVLPAQEKPTFAVRCFQSALKRLALRDPFAQPCR